MNRVALALVAAALVLPACKKQQPVANVDAQQNTTAQVTKPPKDVAEAIDQMAFNFSRLHFQYDSSTLEDASKRALASNVEIMQKFPTINVEVQGHADERGTVEYNLALGQRRAEAVRTYMTAMGVSASRVKAVSFGEEVPLAKGTGEVAWSQNRRAEFRITSGDEGRIRGTTN